MTTPRTDAPFTIGVNTSNPQLVEDILTALDDCTAVRRIPRSRFVLEAVCHFLTLPAYARDQAMHTNKYALPGPGRPSKEATHDHN